MGLLRTVLTMTSRPSPPAAGDAAPQEEEPLELDLGAPPKQRSPRSRTLPPLRGRLPADVSGLPTLDLPLPPPVVRAKSPAPTKRDPVKAAKKAPAKAAKKAPTKKAPAKAAKKAPAKRAKRPKYLSAAMNPVVSDVPLVPPATPSEYLPTAYDLGVEASLVAGQVLGVADVLCDETGRLGALSYIVPEDLTVRLGDAVHVPFGTRELHGVVIGLGRPERATREVIRVYGKRAAEAEISLAAALAKRHYSDLVAIATRLSPRSGRGHGPLDAGDVVLAPLPRLTYPKLADSVTRRFLVRAPLVDPSVLAAHEAERLAAASPSAQVLVLCPTVELVDAVCARFVSGAARVDTKMEKGAWRGFAEGSVKVAVGTRAAALYSASDLAGIVVVEEDHPGHLEAMQPYTNARDVAAARSSVLGIPLVLVGSNPTPAGLGAKVKAVPVGTKGDWPRMRLVDRSEFAPDSRLVPPPLAAMISRAAKSGVKPLVLSQSRKATRRCTRCGLERPCTECTSSTCRHQEQAPCTRCESTAVRMIGWDAKRLSQLLGNEVEALPAKDLVEYAHAQSQLPPGEQTPRLVVVFDVDAALSSPSLAPEALASHLLLTAARAAGRGGQVAVLTSDPSHPLLQDLCQQRDQLAAAKRSWDAAKDAGLPPFGRLVTVRTGQESAPRTASWPGTVYGPRRAGSEWEVLVKLDDPDLEALRPHLERLRRGGKVRVTVA